ncbi:AMP-binding protein [Paraburkholderia graminis]|uniref:AMP-binding protein n=1 Tax=Paraburkholderia graminis TaxID=60548 RepID=UPI0038BD418C
MREQQLNGTPATFPTTVSLIFRALRRHRGKIAFEWDGGALSYEGVHAQLGRYQAAMVSRGVDSSSRVALISSNRVEAWCAAIAAQALGCLTTWLHPRGSLEDHLEQLRDAGIDTIVVDVEGFGERGSAIAEAVPEVLRIFTIGLADYGRNLVVLSELAGEHSPHNCAHPHSFSNLSYTGGTTGRSKAALRTQSTQAAISMAILSDFELPPTPRLLCVAPMSHVGGTKIVPTLMRGGTVYLARSFDPDRAMRTIEDRRLNMTLLVPSMIYMLLDHPQLGRRDLSSLEMLLYGGSAMSPSRLTEGLERLGPVFAQLYGQTECYPISTLRRADHDLSRPELLSSCGQPVSFCDVRLLDDDLQEVPTGESGEICVRGPHMMTSYWGQPELSEQALAGGWLHTGDVARTDERGYIYIVDRKKDMIVSGGFNVYPREIEDALATHPAVAMSAVIGVPDSKWGEAVIAVVVRRKGVQVTERMLIDLVKEKKGSRQAPKRIVFADSLPTTAVGKIDKKLIREPFWAGHSRQVA